MRPGRLAGIGDGVMLGRLRESGPAARSAPVRRIMAATDGSETAAAATAWAADMAERYGAVLVLVRVVVPAGPPATGGQRATAALAEDAARELRRTAADFGGESAEAVVLVSADPSGAIVDAARDGAIDVLVLGNKGMQGRKEFLLGNVPNRVTHNAACTVVIVNTGDERAGAGPRRLRPRRRPG